ncbi:MAG: hypothetical protein RSE62_03375 [Citrobacter sp.]
MIHTAATKFAVKAIALGYTVVLEDGHSRDNFRVAKFTLNDIEVFETSRGWRVAQFNPDTRTFHESVPGDYYKTLPGALNMGRVRATGHHPSTNPLLAPMHDVLQAISSGWPSGNPYCNKVFKRAMQAVAAVVGHGGDWMNALASVPKDSPVLSVQEQKALDLYNKEKCEGNK